MLGVLRMSWDAAATLNLRQLTRMLDAHLLESWNHTSLLAYIGRATSEITACTWSKRRPDFGQQEDFHPYRQAAKNQNGKIKITRENVSTSLKAIAMAVGRSTR